LVAADSELFILAVAEDGLKAFVEPLFASRSRSPSYATEPSVSSIIADVIGLGVGDNEVNRTL